MQDNTHPSEDRSTHPGSLRENVTTSDVVDDPVPSVEPDVHLLELESHQLASDRPTIEATRLETGHATSVQSTCEETNPNEIPTPDNTWLPLGLQSSFLICLSATAFSAAAVCIGLLVHSSSNYGLGDDDGRLSLSFAWRFLPTLIAVLYSIGTSIVFNDVNRTEAFARLSQPTLSDARWTLCRTPGAWWTTLGEALSKKRNGQRTNWVLLFTTVVNIFSFLAISPLSSSLLDSLATAISSTSLFSHSNVFADDRLPFNANQDATLRTTAHQLQNLTTSAWVNDEYVILPFGTTEGASVETGPTLTDTSVQWKTSAIVVKTEMECEVMHLTYLLTGLPKVNSTRTYSTISFSDGKGCNLTFGAAGLTTSYPVGVGSWFTAPDYIEAWPVTTVPWIEGLRPNITEQCRDREIILAISSWPLPPQVNSTELRSNDSSATCYVCDTRFYVANSSVAVSTDNQGMSSILVDADDFVRNRKVLQPKLLDTTLFQRLMVSANWTSVLDKSGKYVSTPYTGGPLRLLSAMYNFDIRKLIMDPDLTEKANRFKQRFLGETIMAAFEDISKLNRTQVMAEVTVEKQRIVVSTGVAITLIVLLSLSGMQLLFVLFATRLVRRPLHVDQDPSSLSGFATLLLHQRSKSTCKLFYEATQATSSDLASMLSDTRHRLAENGLYSIGALQPLQITSKRDDWRPLATKRRNGLGMLLYLVILMGGVAAFWAIYWRSGLHGPAFSYEGHLIITGSKFKSTFTFAPYSMVPTLLAVFLSLWWSDIVQTFRRIQPYIEMAKGPTLMSFGPRLTYASSYIVFGAFKAARKRHWVLSLIFLGSVATEIFTVSMSAIWRRKPVLINEQVTLTPQFEFRTSPQMFHFTAPEDGSEFSIPSETLAALYSSLNSNWMYSALLQLVFNASEPPWSKSGWSFTPLDLSTISNSSALTQGLSSKQLADRHLLLDHSAINVTVRTPALRARLECSPYERASNLSSWLTQWTLTNGTQWNLSTNPLDLDVGYQVGYIDRVNFMGGFEKPNWNNGMMLKFGRADVSIPILNYGAPLQCCVHASSGTTEPMSVGYWTYGSYFYDHSSSSTSSFYQRSSTRGDNFTTKLIYGFAQQQLYQMNTSFKDINRWNIEGNLIWRDVPKLTALNCQPVIEFADAEVKIDRSSAMVQDFQILSPPQIIQNDAWNASYNLVNYTAKAYRGKPANYVTSYGVLFEDALILASDQKYIGGLPSGGYLTSESVEDRTFNYRTPGLNMDFMTYAMYNVIGKDPTALLDPVVQARLANLVFGTFFQHFVSSNVTKDGSWTYVPIGTNKFDPNLKPYNHSTYPVYDKVIATVSRRVEGLEMSPVATSLCLGVLSLLIITTIVVYIIDFRHFDRLRHDVATMADVIRLICDSPRFLAWVADTSRAKDTNGHQPPAESGANILRNWRRFGKPSSYQALAQKIERQREPKVRLGTFIGTGEKRKWIVEIDD